MNSRFWSLETPRWEGLAEHARDMDFEQILCPAHEGHRRGGKRIGALSVVVHPSRVGDFTFSWLSDVLVSRRVLDIFAKHQVTGFEVKPAKISYPATIEARPPDLFELVVTGWGGLAAAAAGVKLIKSCPGCGKKTYMIAEPSRLIDATAWEEATSSSFGHCPVINLPATAWRISFGRRGSLASSSFPHRRFQ
jgi:hypothetical protein